MFSRKFRLPSSVRFINPRVIRNPFFTAKIAPNTLSHNRYGFIVPKRVDKRAVIRNSNKRVFRGIVESLHPSIPQGKDYLFVLSKNILSDQEQMQGLLGEML